MHAKLAMHEGLVKHLANGAAHFDTTHLPTAAGSDTATAGGETPTFIANAAPITAAINVAAVARTRCINVPFEVSTHS